MTGDEQDLGGREGFDNGPRGGGGNKAMGCQHSLLRAVVNVMEWREGKEWGEGIYKSHGKRACTVSYPLLAW